MAMFIEVKSVPDPRRPILQSRCVRLGAVLLTIALVIGFGIVVRSYRHYSQIIDARLASGYLTSRPGLYAAPRVLRPGQKLSSEKLVAALRRAGYLETTASDVWSGSFAIKNSAIEIKPGRASRKEFELVRVGFSGDQIAELSGDGITIDSFTLEPEILSNDVSSKSAKRELLSYEELPPVLVQSILAIEDRRFFEHSGVDLNGLGRALLRNAVDDELGQGGS